MGAIQETSAIFLSIADGKISRRVKAKTEKSVERTTKQGKVVNEEFYRGWKGRITNIAVREHPEFGKFWNVTLADEEGEAVLQMDYSSRYASNFFKMLPNVDLSKEVAIQPSLKMEGDKKITALFMYQNGGALKHFFTKDDPKGLPQMRQVKVKGQLQWDDSDMNEFFENMVKTEILPKIKAIAAAPKPQHEEYENHGVDVVDDNLPF